MNARLRLQYRIQSGMFVLLFIILIGVLGWISNRYSINFDMSANQRNSLSGESLRLLANIEYPLKITLFVSPINESKQLLETLLTRYLKRQPNIRFSSLNPDLHPDLLRTHDIRYDGEVLLEYQGRHEKISQISEISISTAIQRLLRQGERWLAFLEGHGERHPYRDANYDFSQFATQLARRGYNIESLNLIDNNAIPENSDVLILASPKVPLLSGELDLLREHIDQGGNLLWLADPEQAIDGLDLLADLLAVEFLPGILVDPNSQLMGLDRIDFTLVGKYPRHPVTLDLDSISLFPQAQALTFHQAEGWQQQIFLQSDSRSWNETGAMRGEIFNGDNDDESAGPHTLGLTLTRNLQRPEGETYVQRIAIVGDADFLANRYLGNGSNLEIGVNLLNWLSHDDKLIAISPRPAPDTRLELSAAQQIAIAIFFLVLLPLGLLANGLRIWLQRRKR